ncbi:antiviral reverse transcriptase Drt3b [Vibrio sp. 99K-1]|uniref:antiviral reverse transcriptase Drt3b n=1 Tax=Vibrio sp. 99K-1 TaxID=2607603 RepID=UPI00149394FA|nr:antiviral reverse transcriptase Drt3b [Vibrio sp. 99K-1]NOI86994.1 RNA-directed DNA polymerase [Vibrio sp. 99K-1]
MKKIKITLSKRDFHRVLLTDVLPYEVPFILTNEGFYKASKNSQAQSTYNVIESILFRNNSETRPLAYKITKDSASERTLYLPHPAIQLKVCNLYRDYNQLITHLCNRSSFSLRYPSKIAHSYYAKSNSSSSDPSEKLKDEGVAIDGDREPIYASTFFEYKDVSFLYKFYDSYQFHRIEKKFDKLFKFDIAKCFSSISTFQLSKSIRDIESYIKSKNHHSFENIFEKLMNDANLGDQHGVIVGPEFSRVFSEILLQSIDCEVKSKLMHNDSLFESSDYVVKRYVDDYFLFYNDEQVRDLVYRTIIEELESYKLYCNESKNQYFDVPFITGVTIAKQQYKHLINSLFSKFNHIDEEKKIMGINSPMNRYHQISNQLITDIKCIVFNNKISYSSITGYYFTLARIKVSEIEEHIFYIKDNQEQCDKLTNFLLIIIELSFFVHSMDFRVRSTYLISQIVIMINKISSYLGSINSEIIKKKIYDESYLSIKTSIKKNTMRDIECLNLLIAIRDIDISYQLSKEFLEKIVNLDDVEKTNYFSLMTSLFYVQEKKSYSSTRTKVVKCILEKFDSDYFTVENDSELTHILFDSLSCPYLTRKMKIKIADRALSKLYNLDESEVESIVDQVSEKNWFIDWDISSSESIERLLMKKELKSPYGN